MKLVVFSVHYRYPELLEDQARRISVCRAALLERRGLDSIFGLVLHAETNDAVRRAATQLATSTNDVCILDVGRPRRARGGRLHAGGLAAAFEMLTAEGGLTDDDLLVVIDHDCHPVDDAALADPSELMVRQPTLGAVGVPQWHRGHCYVHPAFTMMRVALVTEMGVEWAFHPRGGVATHVEGAHDTCEGYTLWCRRHGVPVAPMRVDSTLFPWSRWDSQNVDEGGTSLVGEHGERVVVGHLMRYGLQSGQPLVSHVWAAPLARASSPFSDHRWSDVLRAYLDEPQITVAQGQRR